MFVLSRAQIQRLLRREQRIGGSLLDIGAGDGNVTESIASLVDQVTSTEVSGPMVKSLNSRGFNCVQTADLDHEFVQGHQPYNVIRYSIRNCLLAELKCTPYNLLLIG
jgi:16S rRNA A1518/A1519 N6-dimethyltransferase RsmA/KsgA/DIM1 with predicted DNA glycosylase/AP lyase activity